MRSTRLPPRVRAAYGAAGAAAIHGTLQALALTCKLEIENEAALQAAPSCIFCYWHRDAVRGFVFLLQHERSRRFAALCHPAPMLEPWVVLGRRLNWQVELGSTGHGGRAAAARITEWLRLGYSTFVCPDGPAGPPEVPKRGALQMALDSGCPVVPLRFEGELEVALPRWDRLRVPLPGSRMVVRCAEPIFVSPGGVDEAAVRLKRALDG